MSLRYFYEFGRFRLDPAERVLFRDGQPVALPPKDVDTLLVLLQNPGHVVGKTELLEKVWPNTFVEEANLARHVSNLRQALGANVLAAAGDKPRALDWLEKAFADRDDELAHRSGGLRRGRSERARLNTW